LLDILIALEQEIMIMRKEHKKKTKNKKKKHETAFTDKVVKITSRIGDRDQN